MGETTIVSGPIHFKGRDLINVTIRRNGHYFLLIYDAALGEEAYHCTESWLESPLPFLEEDQWFTGLHIQAHEDGDEG